MKISILVLTTLSLSLFSCTKEPGQYNNSVVDLGLGFAAKQMCSCLFVVEQDEEFCRDFIRIKQLNPTVKVQPNAVESSYFWLFKARAEFRSPAKGCVLL